MKNSRTKFFILLSGFITLSIVASAQPDINPPDPQVPIDGGISLLAAAGVAYGAKKLYAYNKQRNFGEDEIS